MPVIQLVEITASQFPDYGNIDLHNHTSAEEDRASNSDYALALVPSDTAIKAVDVCKGRGVEYVPLSAPTSPPSVGKGKSASSCAFAD